MPSSLEVLKQWTRVVADTGDFDQLTKFTPQDATTNPSLIYQAVQLPQYKDLVAKVIKEVRTGEETIKDSLIDHIVDCLYVAFGCEILKIIPGVVSTEVDARLSFDIEGSVAKARKIIHMYEGAGYNRSRVLIKLATTWEGCEAAKILQNEGNYFRELPRICICRCNLRSGLFMVFSISPFFLIIQGLTAT